MTTAAEQESYERYHRACPNGPNEFNVPDWLPEAKRQFVHPNMNAMQLGEWAVEFGPALLVLAERWLNAEPGSDP